MPRLSDSMEEGTVAKWLVEEGASVTRGQPLVEIDTDKATMEYEAESDGTLLQILVAEGETAPIGARSPRGGAGGGGRRGGRGGRGRPCGGAGGPGGRSPGRRLAGTGGRARSAGERLADRE